VRFRSHAFQVLYNLLSALSIKPSHPCALYNESGGQWSARSTLGEWGRGRRPDGHNGVISITGSAISPASVHALTLDRTQTVTWSRQRWTGFDRRSAGQSTTFDAERDLYLTDCELVTEKKSMPKFVNRPVPPQLSVINGGDRAYRENKHCYVDATAIHPTITNYGSQKNRNQNQIRDVRRQNR